MNDISNEKLSDKMADIVNKLVIVRDDYKATKDELNNSIRKDIIKAELKDALQNTDNYINLKANIEKIIENM